MKIFKLILLGLSLSVSLAMAESPTCSNTDLNNKPVEGASYVGAYDGVDNKLPSHIFYREYFCAEKFIKKYPNKFLTIFGSSRIWEKTNQEKYNAKENDALYKQTYEFSKMWTQKHGDKYHVLTGAGPGLMEAAAIGALDGKGKSIGYTTYYKKAADNSDPQIAYWKPLSGTRKGERIISDGLIFTSVSVRETMMIMHSAAVVIVPGGGGTNWEIFQMLEMLESKQLTRIPVYFLGDRIHWSAYETYINDMIARGTIKKDDREQFVKFVETNEELMSLLESETELFPNN